VDFDSQQGQIFFSSSHPNWLWETLNFIPIGYREFFTWNQMVPGVELTTHLHLVLRLKMCGIIHTPLHVLVVVNPLKTEFLLSDIYRSSLYLTGNTLRLHYRAQPVNAVWGNSRCLL
jgi:hypothetical protein